jgi:hypothetical protein
MRGKVDMQMSTKSERVYQPQSVAGAALRANPFLSGAQWFSVRSVNQRFKTWTDRD